MALVRFVILHVQILKLDLFPDRRRFRSTGLL